MMGVPRASSLALFWEGPPHTPTDHGAACDWGSGTALCRRPTLTAQLLKLPGGTRHGLGSQTTITRECLLGRGTGVVFPGIAGWGAGEGGGNKVITRMRTGALLFSPHTPTTTAANGRRPQLKRVGKGDHSVSPHPQI